MPSTLCIRVTKMASNRLFLVLFISVCFPKQILRWPKINIPPSLANQHNFFQMDGIHNWSSYLTLSLSGHERQPIYTVKAKWWNIWITKHPHKLVKWNKLRIKNNCFTLAWGFKTKEVKVTATEWPVDSLACFQSIKWTKPNASW